MNRKILFLLLTLLLLSVCLVGCQKEDHTSDINKDTFDKADETNEADVVSIEILKTPQKTEYFLNEALDTTGLLLKATYSDGTVKNIPYSFSVSPRKLSSAGTQTITVAYGKKTATFTVNVLPYSVSSIEISTLPVNTVYYNGEVLDTTGLTLTVQYDTGKTESITSNFTYSAPHLITTKMEETKNVTVTYGGKSATFSVTVKYASTCLLYQRDGNGYLVSGIEKNYDDTIIIPPRYRGLPVTAIGMGAFNNGIKISAITIPDSVSTIDDYAFSGCTALTSIAIPDSVTTIGINAFFNCTSLADISIPDSVTSIGNQAFENTDYYNNQKRWTNNVLYIGKHLIKAKITNTSNYSVKKDTLVIADNAFSGCTLLTSITIPDSVTHIGSKAFYNTGYCNYSGNWTNDVLYIGKHLIEARDTLSDSYAIKSGTLVIADDAFLNCRLLTSISIPDGITTIGHNAFAGCTVLTSIAIPNSVTEIGFNAFTNCRSLVAITVASENTVYYSQDNCVIEKSTKALIIGCNTSVIPNNVTAIGDYAFSGRISLTSISIPDGVTTIGNYAFYGCTSLTSAFLPDSVTAIKSYAFSGCTTLSSLTIPNNITYIGNGAFLNCKALTSVFFPNSITEISDSAFSGCTSLASVFFPNSIDTIGSGAFSGCTSLTSITIPISVFTIGSGAFSDCASLKTVYCEVETIPYGWSSSWLRSWSSNCHATVYWGYKEN